MGVQTIFYLFIIQEQAEILSLKKR
jgi:hypothetical protein